jgi:HEAT repeat protein
MDSKKLKIALRSKNKKTRAKAVDQIALTMKEDAANLLIECLENDPEADVRRRAALALGRLESNAGREVLFETMSEDEDEETRKNAAIALGKIFDERAILPLYQFHSQPRKGGFFKNIDRARINLVLTEFAQKKGCKTIEDLVEWYTNKRNNEE